MLLPLFRFASWHCSTRSQTSTRQQTMAAERRNGNILVFGGRKKEVDNTSVLVASCVTHQETSSRTHGVHLQMKTFSTPPSKSTYKHSHTHTDTFNVVYWALHAVSAWVFYESAHSGINSYVLHVFVWAFSFLFLQLYAGVGSESFWSCGVCDYE